MSSKKISIRGEMVDFDLLALKGQMLNTPSNEDSKKRERFIDKKRRRTNRGSVDQLLAQQKQNEAAVREAMAAKKAELAANPEVKSQEPTISTEPVVNMPVAAPEPKINPKRIVKKTR